MREYETLRFIADAEGQQRKTAVLNWMSQRGWRVTTETVDTGHYKGRDACCLFTLCPPLVFLTSKTPNVVVVNLERDSESSPQWLAAPNDGHEHRLVRFDDNRLICELCGITQESYRR